MASTRSRSASSAGEINGAGQVFEENERPDKFEKPQSRPRLVMFISAEAFALRMSPVLIPPAGPAG